MFDTFNVHLATAIGIIVLILVGVVLVWLSLNRDIKRNKALAAAEEERIRALPLLMNCPACQKEISRVSFSCPSCGHPINAQSGTAMTQRTWNPGIAAVLSFIIPGLGQIYKGQVLIGIAWFIFVIGGYVLLIIPGIILHLICVITAATGSR